MSTLGFEDYIEPLKLYLHKYREVRCGPERDTAEPVQMASGCAFCCTLAAGHGEAEACDASAQAEKQSLAKQAAGEGKKEPAPSSLPSGFQTHVRPRTVPLDSIHAHGTAMTCTCPILHCGAPPHQWRHQCCSSPSELLTAGVVSSAVEGQTDVLLCACCRCSQTTWHTRTTSTCRWAHLPDHMRVSAQAAIVQSCNWWPCGAPIVCVRQYAELLGHADQPGVPPAAIAPLCRLPAVNLVPSIATCWRRL